MGPSRGRWSRCRCRVLRGPLAMVQACMLAGKCTLVEASLWGLAWAQVSERAPV